MAQVIGISIYAFAALGLALGLVFGFAGLLHAGTRSRNQLLPWTFFAIIVAIMAAPLFTGRVLSATRPYSEATLDEIGSSLWVTRILTVVVIALCTECIVRFFLRNREALERWPLLWSFFAFAIAGEVLNGALGAKPSFDHKSLYAFPLYFAFFIVAQREPERCFRFARWALMLFFVGSAVAALAKPSAVIEFGYAGLPGLNFRYYGLATHANTLGPLAIAFMIVLWRFPFPVRWFNLLAWALMAGSLVLSQSKTSIVVAGGIGLFLLTNHYRTELVRAKPGAAMQFALLLWIVGCIALALVAIGVLAGANYTDWAMGKLDTVTGGQWETLSGRTRIWAVAWHEFRIHPVFGYGPTIWDPEYRFYAQLPSAFHAHNQLLQSLSSAGAVGGITLFIYAAMLTIYASRALSTSGGIAVAFVALMLVRSISEVPFSTGSVMQAEFFVQLLALCACVAFAKQPESPATTTVGTDRRNRAGNARASAFQPRSA